MTRHRESLGIKDLIPCVVNYWGQVQCHHFFRIHFEFWTREIMEKLTVL